MTPTRNTIGAHAQDLMVDEEFLLPIVKTLAVSLLTAGYSKCLMIFFCLRGLEESVDRTNSRVVVLPFPL